MPEHEDWTGRLLEKLDKKQDEVLELRRKNADLLAALETVEEVLANARSAKGSYPNLLVIVRAAIAKAKGESQERLDSTTRLGKAMVDATRLERNEAKRWDQ